MTFKEFGFSLKTGFKKIVLSQKFVLVMNQESQKKLLTPKFPLHIYYTKGVRQYRA